MKRTQKLLGLSLDISSTNSPSEHFSDAIILFSKYRNLPLSDTFSSALVTSGSSREPLGNTWDTTNETYNLSKPRIFTKKKCNNSVCSVLFSFKSKMRKVLVSSSVYSSVYNLRVSNPKLWLFWTDLRYVCPQIILITIQGLVAGLVTTKLHCFQGGIIIFWVGSPNLCKSINT
jgi:hypothetical protein